MRVGGFVGEVIGEIEVNEARVGIEEEFADRAVLHHAIPARIVVVEQNAERDRERSAMRDHHDALTRVLARDIAQCT